MIPRFIQLLSHHALEIYFNISNFYILVKIPIIIELSPRMVQGFFSALSFFGAKQIWKILFIKLDDFFL